MTEIDLGFFVMVNRRQLLRFTALGTASFAAPSAYSTSERTMTFNTGNPVPSTDPRDLSDNAENLDRLASGANPFYPDRLGKQRLSWAGMESEFGNAQEGREDQFQQFLSNSGYEAPISYAAGQTLLRATQTFVRSDVIYRIKDPANLPYQLTGNWAVEAPKFAVVADGGVRQALAAPEGAAIVGFTAADALAAAKTVEEKLRGFVERSDFTTDAAFNTNKAGKLSRDATGRLRTQSFIAGTEELAGATVRDAFVVGRNVVGETNCHGFADRTAMYEVTDFGAYGAFDSTVSLYGDHNQNHVYSFQDRVKYFGNGAVEILGGLMSKPQLFGNGSINNRFGALIQDVVKEAGSTGKVDSQIGVFVHDLTAATQNIGMNLAQSTGYAMYMGGGAPSYHKGSFRVGGDSPVSSKIAAITVSGAACGMSSDATAATVGSITPHPTRVTVNGSTVLELMTTSGSSAVRPGVDNAQPLGDLTRRWSQLYAGTGTISTSDAREKTEVRALNAAEIAAAKDLAKEIGAFRFLSAVNVKGDSAREHIGMTVQRAIEVMQSHGLDPFGYSFICYDEWKAQREIRNKETGEVEQEAIPAGNRFSFRFDGLLAFISAGFEARLSALESLQG